MPRLDYVSCVLTILSTILVGRRYWEGWALAAVNSVVICVIGLRTGQFGFIPANMFCLVLYGVNVRSWRGKGEVLESAGLHSAALRVNTAGRGTNLRRSMKMGAMKVLIACVLLGSMCFAADEMSHTCKFTRGPLQGQTHTLANRSATLVGSTCTDGLTSSGVTVPEPSPELERMSHTCKFNRGPLQGQTHTLSNRDAVAIGSTCTDGLTSSGIAVRDPNVPEDSERMSHTCKFNRGPLQGQTQTLPNRPSTRVGSTCSDGLTSTGITVADPL